MTFLDAGPLVALLDRREEYHSWSVAKMREIRGPLVTCEAVISEVCFLLGDLSRARVQLRLWIQSGFVGCTSVNITGVSRALIVMERYANVPMSFADACLVAIAEREPQARIFTLDRDFLIYRREGDQPLSLIAPFAG